MKSMLTGKVILIISPDSWSHVFISKHNYSVEAAQKGNLVYFLSPIENKLKKGEVTIEDSGFENLFVVRYQPWFPIFLRFQLPQLFHWLMNRQAKKIVKVIGKPIDIVWDFNPLPLFNDLRIFRAPISIFHPVDKILNKVDNRGANIVFSLSQEIFDMVQSDKAPKVFINHGLSKSYVKELSGNGISSSMEKRVKICYVGNLMIHSIDFELMQQIIEENSVVDFHFIGPYENAGNPLGMSSNNQSDLFVAFLKKQAHVTLYGAMKSSEVARKLKEFDGFILCYKQSKYFSNDNSHKILEYLSTGKVIISTHITHYRNEDFLVMSPKENNKAFANLFREVVTNISTYNSKELADKRIAYALDNTYEKQMERIEGSLLTIATH
ncbi:MAG TPA: hypothetical protein VM888_11630 [Chitinophagaceae bacterium]|nr:hypothetical protein [Chitinophagaceae bacterium]